MDEKNTTLTTPDTLDVKDETTTTQLEEHVENNVDEETGSEKNELVDKIWNDENLDLEELSELSNKGNEPMVQTQDKSTPEEQQEQSTEPIVAGLTISNPVLKFKGRELKIDSPDEMIALAQKGLLLELEQGKIKPHKKTIKLIEDNGLTQEDIVALVDAKNGNKQAINYLSEKFGIKQEKESNDFDVFSSSDDENNIDEYKPKIQDVNPVQEWFEEYSSNNKENGAKVVDTINNIDDSFFAELYNPTVFPVFVEHVEKGIFDKAYPKAVTIKATNSTLNWISAYNQAINSVFGSNQNTKKEPPAETSVPKSTTRTKSTVQTDSANKVWDDDNYYEQLKQRLGFN